MTGQRETTRYAQPSMVTGCVATTWVVTAYPWKQCVGTVSRYPSGWTATTATGRLLGLWPTKQAAAEVLVKQAGYELELT